MVNWEIGIEREREGGGVRERVPDEIGFASGVFSCLRCLATGSGVGRGGSPLATPHHNRHTRTHTHTHTHTHTLNYASPSQVSETIEFKKINGACIQTSTHASEKKDTTQTVCVCIGRVCV